MLQLNNVTLLAIATKDVQQAAKALAYSCRAIEFAAVKLVSHYRPEGLHANIAYEPVHKMHSIDDWNHYAFYNMWKHVDTEFGLLIHEDGFVVHPESWSAAFLHYDYIGAPWPLVQGLYCDKDKNVIRVGNSVSIRSRRLMKLPSELEIPWQRFEGNYNEDTQICVHNRHIFLQHGIQYAPLEIAKHFSHETLIPEIAGIKPFCFHKYFSSGHPNYNYPRL